VIARFNHVLCKQKLNKSCSNGEQPISRERYGGALLIIGIRNRKLQCFPQPVPAIEIMFNVFLDCFYCLLLPDPDINVFISIYVVDPLVFLLDALGKVPHLEQGAMNECRLLGITISGENLTEFIPKIKVICSTRS